MIGPNLAVPANWLEIAAIDQSEAGDVVKRQLCQRGVEKRGSGKGLYERGVKI